ncbi:MAG: hypothetical protein R3D83_03960 [Caenibius sp.]
MGTAPAWTRSTWTDARQLAKLADTDGDHAQAVGQAPHAWFAQMVDAGQLQQAVGFIAHALPRYDCIAWAVRALIETNLVERHDPLILGVLRWMDDPGDNSRRAAGQLADETDSDSPQKLLAQAVFLSGGSLVSEDLPAIQPQGDLCAKLVSAALLVAAFDRDDPETLLHTILKLGETIARGE